MIELRSNGYVAIIDPAHGGSCIRLSRFGVEVLRSPATLADLETSPFFYGTPPLFFPNRISQGKFIFDGRQYEFPINEPETGCFIHGIIHKTAFDIISISSNNALLQYKATPLKPYLSFPHAFTFHMDWELDKDGLHQKVTISNDSETNMPVALGFHTTFNLLFTEKSKTNAITLQLDTSVEYSRNMQNYLPDGKAYTDYPDKQELLNGSLCPGLNKMSRLFKMGTDKTMVLTDPLSEVKVRYTALRGYDYWMVYNGLSSDFISVEPQSWLSNCPNAPFPREKTGFSFLLPRERKVYETCLSIDRV